MERFIAVILQSEPSKTKKDTFDNLTSQLQSNKYADWDAVASCDYTTSYHLLIAAKQCATISNSPEWAKRIATSICGNPSATGKVIKELVNSEYYPVIDIAAQSKYADEEALIAIAKECAEISNSKDWAKEIATSICGNPSATDNVIKELANSKFTSVTSIAHAKLNAMQ